MSLRFRIVPVLEYFVCLKNPVVNSGKVIYVARNPKDCVVSFYHHNKLVPSHGYFGTFDQFIEFFKALLQPNTIITNSIFLKKNRSLPRPPDC